MNNYKNRMMPALGSMGFISLSLGAVISIFLFSLSRQIEQEELTSQLQGYADEQSTAIVAELEALLKVVRGLAGLYAASNQVDPDGFESFLKLALPKEGEIRSAVWLEYVPTSKIREFSNKAQKDGYGEIAILTDNQNKTVSTQHNGHLIVYHTYDQEEKPWLHRGLDMATIDTYREQLIQSRNSGNLFTLLQKNLDIDDLGPSLEVFMPVYHAQRGHNHSSNKPLQDRLHGFVAFNINLGNSVDAAFNHYAIKPDGYDIFLANVDRRWKPDIFYSHISKTSQPSSNLPTLAEVVNDSYVDSDLNFVDTQWQLIIRPFKNRYEPGKAIQPWLALLSCLIITLFLSTFLNNIQRRKTEIESQVERRTEELKDSREEIRVILETVIDAIITIDDQGIMRSFNQAAEHIFGYSKEEVIGKNVSILMPEPYAKEHDRYIQHYLQSGTAKIIGIGREVKGQRKDQSIFPMELSVNEAVIDGQHIFTGIVRDITRRKQAEDELQSVTILREAILNSANFTIISTDTNGLIKTFNQGAENMLGYSAEEMIDKETPAIIHDPNEVVSRAKALTTELGQEVQPGFEVFVIKAARGLPDENEWTYIRKDGSRFPVLLSVTALHDNNGNISGYLGIGSDITERKKAESLKAEFIATVSHELRTPLTSIKGALNLVLGKVNDGISEKAKNLLLTAERNSERLTLLINDILDIEKMESGSIRFELECIDLVKLALQAINDYEGYALEHKITLQLDTTLVEAKVLADPNRMLQVLANLISNAIKFSDTNSTVHIRIEARNETFRVSVQDHGQGIEEHFHDSIFQRFSQADSSDSREKGGTGLGLNIAKAIIEQHSGTIDFVTSIGQGTTFFFDLMKYGPANNAPSERRLLVCEDNMDVANIIAKLAESEGWRCDIANTAKSAMTLLFSHQYDLLLLDLNLPDADGMDLLKQLRKKPQTEHIPVIVISARSLDGEAKLASTTLAVNDWLQKPIEPERLRRALEAVLIKRKRPSILHIEDDPDIIQITKSLVEGFADLHYASSLHLARQKLLNNRYDLVLLDLTLTDGNGVDLLTEIQDHCPVVIFSANQINQDITDQVNATLTKSVTNNEQLLKTIKNALYHPGDAA